jgi:energy-coupling factor transporter ATP-binding protein EcfA2
MAATISKSVQASQRRERFREYMRKLNPSSPARLAIDSGLVVKDLHGALFKTLAARADLEPGSQQLLVGGTGSGKTTELLMAEKWLEEQGQTLSLYIDISSETDLSGLNSGALLAGFGRHLARAFFSKGFEADLDDAGRRALKKAWSEIEAFAFGTTKSVWVPDKFQTYVPREIRFGHYVTESVPGKLQPPFPALQREIQAIRKPLEAFISAVRGRSLDILAIFDGLDRLPSPDRFWAIVDQDLRALRQIRVGVMAAAPQSVLYGQGRAVSAHFDRVHQIRALSPEPEDGDYLKSVITQRGGTELLEQDVLQLVCDSSGGVLRDLITLARDAGEAAYIEGAEQILVPHANAAIKQLGESYLRGLGPEQIGILWRLKKERSFDVAASPNIELLVTGRVLEYSATDFRVHPALEPLLPEPESK